MTPSDEQVRAALAIITKCGGRIEMSDHDLLAAEFAEREAALRSQLDAAIDSAHAMMEERDALVRERDEALLNATFREDKHAEELGEKLSAALSQVGALREALEEALYKLGVSAPRWDAALANTADAARERDERIRDDAVRGCVEALTAHRTAENIAAAIRARGAK